MVLRRSGFPLLLLLGLAGVASCSDDGDAGGSDADGGAAAGGDSGGGDTSTDSCERLFGNPTENTGLGAGQCAPTCDACAGGGGDFASTAFTEADLVALKEFVLDNPPALLESDPYEKDVSAGEPGRVCGVTLLGGNEYHLDTYASRSDAEAASAIVTHEGACGMCSSLQDLAVYIERQELTAPVRTCSMQHLSDPVEDRADCIESIGFSPACAQIWAYNTMNTTEYCRDVCLDLFAAPHHEEDGSLNACIQCDEDNSGPVFKAEAGRTRRNSGLPSALCRPCDTVARVHHVYE